MSPEILHAPLAQMRLERPFFESVSAGFPSPAADYMDKKLDLNELCIHNAAATFFIRVQGDSMMNAGIFDGDILIVDRSLLAKKSGYCRRGGRRRFCGQTILPTRKSCLVGCRKSQLLAHHYRRKH